jgi:hypothetical protein
MLTSVNSKTSRAAKAANRAAAGRSPGSSNSSNNRNPVKPASNMKKGTKRTAKKRATIPAPPALAPKNLPRPRGFFFAQRPQSSSASRFTAGAFGFLTFSQCAERPDR